MALFSYVNATALKAMHKAGRRGGDSIAREGSNMYPLYAQGRILRLHNKDLIRNLILELVSFFGEKTL